MKKTLAVLLALVLILAMAACAGTAGKSAYDIWLEAGHEGSEADFLNWLRGEQGEPGKDGEPGPQGPQGEPGVNVSSGFAFAPIRVGGEIVAYSISKGVADLNGHVVLPSTFNGLPVTHIEIDSFQNSRNMTKITIPNSVTSTGSYVFFGCVNLTDIFVQGYISRPSGWSPSWNGSSATIHWANCTCALCR